MPEVPVRCARFFLLPRAHPHERMNEAKRNVSREERVAEHRRPIAEERSGYMELCDVAGLVPKRSLKKIEAPSI